MESLPSIDPGVCGRTHCPHKSFMEVARCILVIVTFLGILSAPPLKALSSAQTLPGPLLPEARTLDGLLQDYAYRAFDRPRTGRPYEAVVPSNLSGISLYVMRLRSGSFRFRGYKSFNEFEIPVGVIVKPYVERLALVYQNLGNLSSLYYQLPGYTLVAPVLGLLAYNATNLSATNLPELDMAASLEPISVRFGDINSRSGITTKCVIFNLDGSIGLNDSSPDNVCKTYRQGHFSIVVSSADLAPAPSPSLTPPRSKGTNMSRVWKIVGSVVGGFLFLVLLALLVFWISRYRRNRKMERMTERAEAGEVLQKRRVGSAQLPTASMIRTRPALEDELAPP